MKYLIKYIENNLLFNTDDECFAYYELTPYNYSFLSNDEKLQVNENFKQLISQYGDDKIHALQIATESSIRKISEVSKNSITGNLGDIAKNKVDMQKKS